MPIFSNHVAEGGEGTARRRWAAMVRTVRKADRSNRTNSLPIGPIENVETAGMICSKWKSRTSHSSTPGNAFFRLGESPANARAVACLATRDVEPTVEEGRILQSIGLTESAMAASAGHEVRGGSRSVVGPGVACWCAPALGPDASDRTSAHETFVARVLVVDFLEAVTPMANTVHNGWTMSDVGA